MKTKTKEPDLPDGMFPQFDEEDDYVPTEKERLLIEDIKANGISLKNVKFNSVTIVL